MTATTTPDTGTMRKAIALAIRAPSIHNSQPWRWRIGAESVHLFADWTRRVPVADPDGRDLVISCGAALHHLRVALAALRWSTTVRRIPNPAAPSHLAAVDFAPQEPSRHALELADAIVRRHTDRRRMSEWPIAPADIELITGRAAGEGALATAVRDPATRFALDSAIAQAAVVQDNHPGYAAELAEWTGRARGGSDGVLAASVPARVPDTGNRRFAAGELAQPSGKRYGQQVAMLVIATSSDDVLSRLRAGEATSAALLTATELGLATSALSQPLEIADTRRTIRDDVLGGAAIPQLLLRLGWAPTTAAPLPTTPRRDIDDIIEPLLD